MNLKRGVNRIALVLSALCFVYFSVHCIGIYIRIVLEDVWDFHMQPIFLYIFLGPIAVWIAVWVVYYMGLFIVKGFHDDKPKDEQNNKS